MSIRHSLLALLVQEPMYGARLRTEFETRTGGTWPLNVGQVYTTLARLERDGMVEASGQADADGTIAYRITDAGRQEVQRWWTVPVDRGSIPRQELAIKLALAVTVPGVDVARLAQTQRTATVRHLQDLTVLKRGGRSGPVEGPGDPPTPAADLSWLLVLEHLIYLAEAEVRWLDHVEASLRRAAIDQSRVRPADRRPATSPADTAEIDDVTRADWGVTPTDRPATHR